MESQNYNNIISAIKSADTQNSQDFAKTTLVGSNQGLYDKTPLSSELTQTGTAVVSQNTVSVRDTSRYKDTTDLIELDWNYKSTTSKPFIVRTGVWTATEAVGDLLSVFSFPRDYFNTNHVLNQIGNTFLSFRGDLHFVITTIGSPFATGAIIASSVYNPNNSTGFDYRDRYFKPHVILDISDNTTSADFIVPFKWCRNSCSPFESAFQVKIEVLNPLQGLTTANYTVTCFLENQEFRFLRPSEATESILFDRRTQGLLNITSISNVLSNIEEANLPMEMQGDQFDTTFGMDDVGINNNPEALLVKFNSLNNSSNPHTIEKVSLKASVLAPSTYDTFNTKTDEMSIKHLFQEREHYFSKFDISTTTASGVQLMNMAVCPNPTTIIGVDVINVAEYIMSLAKFWRGGMKIKLRFFMNRFQSTKIYVGLFYKAITPTVFTDWSSSHGVILDVGGDQREVVIEIPYNAETPWLQVLHDSADVSLPSSRELSIFDYIMGQFTVYSLTPLVSPTGSPTSIECHVTYSMADDFELAGYSTNTRVVQGMETTVKLSKESTRTPENINDVVTSMRDFYRKYQLVSCLHNIPTNSIDYLVFPFSPDWLFSRRDNMTTGDYGTGASVFIAPQQAGQFYGNNLFSAFRGGIKLRWDVDLYAIADDQGRVPWPANYKPYLLYVNPDTLYYQNGAVTFNQILDNIDSSLQKMFDNNGIEPIGTPFEVLPVNVVEQKDSRVFEVEIPWQRNVKYLETYQTIAAGSLYKHFGLALLVFKKQHADSVVSGQVDLRLYAKPADDARYGIAETGRQVLASAAYALWGGNNRRP